MGNSEIYLTKENDTGSFVDIINSDTTRKELFLSKEELECGKIIKTQIETNYGNALKQIVPVIKNSDSVKSLQEKLKI